MIKTESPLENTSSDTESDDEIGRIIVGAVNIGETDDEIVTIKINGKNTTKRVDSGCKETLIGITEFRRLHLGCKLHRTNVKFTPYGTKQQLAIGGRAFVQIAATGGSSIDSWIYVVDDQVESLLGSEDAKALGILVIIPEGKTPNKHSVAANNAYEETKTEQIIKEFDHLFHGVGSFNGDEIKSKIDPDAVPVVQKARPIPLAYREKIEKHLKELKDNDIIEGPLDSDEPLEWLSNIVITNQKWGDGEI